MKPVKADGALHPWLPALSIVLLYCVSYGFMLLNGGLFHDDVEYYLLPHDAFQIWANEVRASWTIYGPLLFKLYSSNYGVYLERIITFLSHLAAGFIFLRLLIRHFNFSRFSSVALFGIFLLFPVFHAKISILVVIYTLSNLCFFAGCWCLYLYLNREYLIFRCLALLFFYLSFYTESILVIYSLVIVFLWHSYAAKKPGIKGIISFLTRHLDFLILPLLFWTLRSLFFYPTGRYAGYTDPSFFSLAISIFKTFAGFDSSLWEPLKQSLIDLLNNPIRTIILFFIPFFCLGESKDSYSNKRELIYLAVGLAAFYLSLFPYFAAGKYEFTGFGSRFQLLVPLGVSLILFFGIRRFLRWVGCSDLFFKIVICALLAAFTVANLEASLHYQKQYIVREALISAIRKDPEINKYHTYLFRDGGYYYYTNPYKPWDAIGLLRQAFNDETHFGMYTTPKDSYHKDVKVFNKFSNKSEKYKLEHGFRDWSLNPGENILVLTLKRSKSFPNQRDAISITFKCLFNKVKCEQVLSDIIVIDKKILTQKGDLITN